MKDFQAFAKRRVGQLASSAMHHILSMDLPLDEYLAKFPKAKRDMYLKGYNEAVDKQQIRNRMTLNVKKEQVCLNDEGESSDRNRAIWS